MMSAEETSAPLVQNGDPPISNKLPEELKKVAMATKYKYEVIDEKTGENLLFIPVCMCEVPNSIKISVESFT